MLAEVIQEDTVLQVDLLWQVHLAGDGGEDEAFLPAVRQRELDLPVQTARSEQRRVQGVGSVGGHDDLRAGQHTDGEKASRFTEFVKKKTNFLLKKVKRVIL